MASKTINISLDEKLIQKIDKAAKGEYASRSDYIRESIVKNLRLEASGDDQLGKEYKKFVKQYGTALKNLADK